MISKNTFARCSGYSWFYQVTFKRDNNSIKDVLLTMQDKRYPKQRSILVYFYAVGNFSLFSGEAGKLQNRTTGILQLQVCLWFFGLVGFRANCIQSTANNLIYAVNNLIYTVNNLIYAANCIRYITITITTTTIIIIDNNKPFRENKIKKNYLTRAVSVKGK